MEAKLACGRKARAVNLRNNFRQLHFVRHAMINLEVIADEEVVVGIQALPVSPWHRVNGRHSLVQLKTSTKALLISVALRALR